MLEPLCDTAIPQSAVMGGALRGADGVRALQPLCMEQLAPGSRRPCPCLGHRSSPRARLPDGEALQKTDGLWE